MKTLKPEDFPFADLLGLRKKVDKPNNLTENQKLGKKLLEIAKRHPKISNEKD